MFQRGSSLSKKQDRVMTSAEKREYGFTSFPSQQPKYGGIGKNHGKDISINCGQGVPTIEGLLNDKSTAHGVISIDEVAKTNRLMILDLKRRKTTLEKVIGPVVGQFEAMGGMSNCYKIFSLSVTGSSYWPYQQILLKLKIISFGTRMSRVATLFGVHTT
ncbi:hypothetical protein G4B88_023031 [Cannabis sativa]|uniref:Uncharacterized protein n=1 Tax=Cannabis sativa TaxID=3483 RepID=A0A7J6HZF2_CANSA|nr:hypothetical protein G4B88_023031 [Cannabis sativa]